MGKVKNEEEVTTTGDNTVQTEEVTVAMPGPKKVKIQVTEDVDCLIACCKHQYAKGKSYQVSSDVAAILCNAQKAFRI